MHPDSGFLALRGRANVVVALLIVTALASALSIMYELDMQALLDRVAAGQPVGIAEGDAADDRAAIAATISLVALVATGIAFITWFHRAYVNIEVLGARDLRAARGWAIGAWFVPFLNLVRPKQLMDDIWRASDPQLPAGELRGWRESKVPGLLTGWWAAFLICSFMSNIAGRMIAATDTLAERASAGNIAMIADAATFGAAVLAIIVVRAVTDRQESRAARVGGGGAPAVYTISDLSSHGMGADPVTAPPPAAGA